MGFQQGLSGLNSSSKSLDVVGNNIANSQTVGFKSGQAQFADVYAASLNGAGSTPVGIGSKVATVVQQFTQGNISVTNNPLDTAINGGGFFQMADATGSLVYSRNGQFQLDKTGYIVNAQGLRLTGIMAVDGVVAQGSPPSALRLFDPTQSLSGTPQATGASTSASGVQANVNLDSRVAPPTEMPFDYKNPNSYTQSTAVTIYDSLGNAHTMSMYFVKVSPLVGIAAAETTTPGAVQTATDLALTTERAAGELGAQAASDAVSSYINNILLPDLTIANDAIAAASIAGDAAAIAAAAAEATAIITAFEQGNYPNNGDLSAKDQAIADAVAAGATLADATLYANKAVNAALATGAAAAANKWNVYATVTNPAGAFPTFTDLSVGGTQTLAGPIDYLNNIGSLEFNSMGAISTGDFAMAITQAQLGYPAAVENMDFQVSFGGSTQFGAPYAVNALIQDGYSSGSLSGFNIGKDGMVLGRYTNGQSKPVGQVVLASFRNPQGLQPLGDNVWSVTPSSGDPIAGEPGSSGQYGVLQSASLEDANVDLTGELVTMIVLQRVYQANAQTIKTQDQVLQTLVNLR